MATLVSKPCPSAGHPADSPRVITVVCSPEQHNAYYQGTAHIQNIFPDMPIDDRERFVTGYCGPCWDAMFDDEDDDAGFQESE